VGAPLRYEGGRTLVGFEIESVESPVDDETFRSVRYLGRVSTRIGDSWVASLRLGGSEIDVASAVHGRATSFEGRPKLALGAAAGWLRPLRREGAELFADASALYTLSSGWTDFTTVIQTNTFHEEYENRYRWIEYQAAAGLRAALPFGAAHAGGLARAVDGAVWRETYQAGALVSSSSDDFSLGVRLYAIGGVDFRLPGRMLLAVTGSARSSDDFAWTVSIAEVSR
jgi:hypothetical protein